MGKVRANFRIRVRALLDANADRKVSSVLKTQINRSQKWAGIASTTNCSLFVAWRKEPVATDTHHSLSFTSSSYKVAKTE